MNDLQELQSRARERAIEERVRVIKLAGTNRYLSRSRTFEPGAYFELFVGPWDHIRCSCPGLGYHGVCKHAVALELRLAKEQGHETVRTDRSLPRAPRPAERTARGRP